MALYDIHLNTNLYTLLQHLKKQSLKDIPESQRPWAPETRFAMFPPMLLEYSAPAHLNSFSSFSFLSSFSESERERTNRIWETATSPFLLGVVMHFSLCNLFIYLFIYCISGKCAIDSWNQHSINYAYNAAAPFENRTSQSAHGV